MESLTITKWWRHFHANKVIADVRVSWVVFIMSMTFKTTKNMCCGLSVVFKITTRHSTIDVRKKSDLSRKNRTTGSPGHVRKIWDWPQPEYSPKEIICHIKDNTSILSHLSTVPAYILMLILLFGHILILVTKKCKFLPIIFTYFNCI